MRLTALACAALLAASLPAAAQLDFGRLINRAIDSGKKLHEANREYTPEQEIALGEGIAAGFLGAAPLDPDQDLQRYVNRVGRWLAMNSARPDLPWTFGVIDTQTINAFAMPGGTVLITRGLLDRLASESELAGALAHEIAHVVKRHQLSAIQSAAGTSALTDIGKDIASDAIDRRGGDVLGLKKWGADAGLEMLKNGVFLRPLDRSMEYEADRLGVLIAARSGYDPYGLVAVLQMLAQAKGDTSGISVFNTHPAPADRLAQLEGFMNANLDRYASQPQVEARFRRAISARR
jgi:predicted Zn-dependent protease